MVSFPLGVAGEIGGNLPSMGKDVYCRRIRFFRQQGEMKVKRRGAKEKRKNANRRPNGRRRRFISGTTNQRNRCSCRKCQTTRFFNLSYGKVSSEIHLPRKYLSHAHSPEPLPQSSVVAQSSNLQSNFS